MTDAAGAASGGATPAGASIREHELDGVAAVTLAAGPYEATFLPGLGMVGTSLRWNGEEHVALPNDLRAYREGHTTGIPLLHPWANRLEHLWYSVDGVHVDIDPGPPAHLLDGLPIHGTMAARSEWRTELAFADSTRAIHQSRFDFGAQPDLLASFPFPHELTVFVELDPDRLRIATTLVATGDRAVPVSFGWHPYLTIPHARRDTLAVRLPDRTHVVLDGRKLPTGEAADEPESTFFLGTRRDLNDRRFDDAYRVRPGAELALEGADRRIVVGFERGYPCAQVYAPFGETFVCLEPMTAPVNALVSGEHPSVPPGGSFTAAFTIAIRPVDDEGDDRG